MINVSEEFQQLMRERTDFKAYAQITLADGRDITVTDETLASSGVMMTDGAGASGLPLGAAVCRTVQLQIVNADGWLDEYDFFGARIRLWLTFALSETVERIELGTFTVTEPETWGETVTVTAADDMIRADKTYVPGQAAEAALGQLWRDVCSQCGIAFSGETFANSDMTVTVPEEECTCRQMLGWIAMLAGGNARIDRQGTARVLAYDGGRGADHTLTDWSALSTDTDDVVITGVEMQTDAGTVLEGEEGYVLTVDNPLAEGREAEALRRLGDVMIGLRLRRFEGRHVAYPLAECMDTVRFRDRRGRWYSSVITDVTFTCGACTEISNSAEGVVRNGSRYVSAETRARQTARKLFQREKTAREALAEQLQKQLAEASGFYTTDVEQPDGSIIRYTHDKPTLAASKNVIKVTGEAIGFSTDGGKTYPFGVSVDGKTIMDIVAANGVIADWITAGILQSQDGRTFFCDLDNGVLKMNATELTIAGKSVGEALSDAVTGVENQFYLSDSPTGLSGGKWENQQPAWTPGKYIWTRQYVTYGDGTNAYLPDEGGVCITGNTGAAGTNGTNGTDGKDGANGKDGAPGANGIGIDTIVAEYYVSTSDETLTGGSWSTSIPEVQSGKYIWTRQKITYTDGNVEYAGQYCMTKTVGDIAQQKVDAQTQQQIFNKLTNNGELKGLYMKDGELYINASFLATGILQDKTGRKFYLDLDNGDLLMDANSLSISGKTVDDIAQGKVDDISIGGTNLLPDSGKELATPSDIPLITVDVRDALSSYVGQEICVSFDAKINDGGTVRPLIFYPYQENGISIESGYRYFTPTRSYTRFSFRTKVVDFGIKDPSYTPGAVAFYDEAGPNDFSIRRIKIELGNTPTDWSPAPEDSRTYTDSAINNQSQESIFNKLTNGGALQGLFMRDGQLYVNASYIKAGILDALAITIAGEYGSLIQGNGMASGGETTSGIAVCGPLGWTEEVVTGIKTPNPPYMFLSNRGFRVQDSWTSGFYIADGAFTLESAFRPYTGKDWMYLDWVDVMGADGNTYKALCGFKSKR